MRDAHTAVFVAALLGVAIAASDAGPVALSSAAALVVTWTAFHLVAILPSLRAPRAGHVVGAIAAALPFAVALELASPRGLGWPLASLGVATGAAALAVRSGGALRRGLAGGVAVALLAAALLDGMALEAPRWLRVPTAPLAARVAVPPASRAARVDLSAFALRAGALAPRSVADAAGFRSTLVDAPWVAVPADADGTVPSRSILVRTIAPAARRTAEGEFVVIAAPELPRDARDLDGTDVVLMLAPLPRDPVGAATLASFVRRGGVLAGPPVPISFGTDLERALGSALPVADGVRGVRPLGLGRVARVAKAEGLDALVAAGVLDAPFTTVFDRATSAPGAPPQSDPRIAPRLADRSLLILAAFGLAAIVASRMRALAGSIAAVALAGVTIGALLTLAPPPPDARSEAFVIDLGGPGGRRLEALRVTAGGEGWRTTAPIRSDAGLRLVGFEASRGPGGEELSLRPAATGWIVEEGPGTGDVAGLAPLSRVPEWSLGLLRRGEGRPPDLRIFAGETPYRGPLPAGVAPPAPARTLVLVPGRP